MNQPERQVYYKVTISVHDDLIAKLKSRKDFNDKKFLPDSENCHFIRYSFLYKKEKVSIVFDTKAEMLTVTAFQEAIEIIDNIYNSIINKLEKKQTKTDINKLEKKQTEKKTGKIKTGMSEQGNSKSKVSEESDNQSEKSDNQSKKFDSQSKKFNNQSEKSDSQSKKFNNQSGKSDNQSGKFDNQSEKSSNQSKKDSLLSGKKEPKKKKSGGLAKVLNNYANDERVYDSSSENYYINYNYQDILKTRINGGMRRDDLQRAVESQSEIQLLQKKTDNQAKNIQPAGNRESIKNETHQPSHSLQTRNRETVAGESKQYEQSIKTQIDNSKVSNDTQRTDGQKLDSQKTDNQRSGNQKFGNQKLDSQRFNNQKLDSQKTDNQRLDNQRANNQRTDNQRVDRKKTNNLKVEEQSENSKVESKVELPEYKDGYSVKKINHDKVKDIINQLEKMSGLKIQNVGTVKGTAGDITTYSVEDSNKRKVYLRHIVKKNMLQLQGKRSDLFGEIQILISRDNEVGIGEQNGGKQQKSGYKEVKKALPIAFEYLSEQSKIDFTIGLIDICSEEVKLSDYSVLLVPPYRGLERLLYDLQKAKGIEVKMIGQAYEKDGGSYTLKSGYRKKIDSIVYNEALSALYTEYFEKRNFYAHSNNTDESVARVISDKLQAKAIFENLMAVINYNCKKLKEISFSVK